MFSNIIKDFFLKRKVKKGLEQYKLNCSNVSIQKVGILIDETYFDETGNLITQLTKNGIDIENIETLFYLDRRRKNIDISKPYFFKNSISWNGNFDNEYVKKFIEKPFDLLISYYDVEKPILLHVTKMSQAKFKAGFHTIDKRINHFMVNLPAESYKEYISELFKYLKILKKI